MKENRQICKRLFSKKNKLKTKNKQMLLFFTTFMLTALSTQTIETYALNYTNWSEWSATAPSNTYGRMVETQTQYMYRDKEFTNQPTSTYSGWTQTGYKYDNISDWKTSSYISHDNCSIGATTNTGYVNGNTGSIANARKTYILSGYWYWDKQTNAGWNQFASTGSDYQTHCGKKVRFKYEENNGSGMVVYAYVNQTRTVTPMWEFWRWKNNGAWTYQWNQPASQAHREIQSRTMYRYRDLIDTTAPTISIAGNPTSWTKNNVTLTITASDSEAGVKSITLPNGTVVNGSSTTYAVSANGNYTFKATDNLGNTSTQTVSVTKIDKTVPTYTSTEIKNITTDGYDIYVYGVSDSQSGAKEVRFPTWTEANGQDDLAPNWTSNASVKGENLGSGTYKFRVNRSEHNNEFGNYITHIYLYDNAGNYHAIGINYNLKDITKPTMSITGNPTSWTKNNVTLTINASDYGTGVKSITKPDGTVVNGSSTTYTVSANGDYTFKVTDHAGNETTQTVSVTKIDKTNPTATVTGNPTSWTKNNATLTITGADTQSGVKSITKPDGTVVTGSSTTYTVTANGTYKFLITDNVGNVLTHNVSVTKIDKTAPTISVTGNPTSWTKNNVTLTITGSDSGSGVKQITKPDGTIITGSSTTYTVTANGNYTFKVTDNAGNETAQTVNVSKIDKTNPTATVSGNPTTWTKNNATLTITGADSQSGVKQITKPDGTVVTGSSTTYTVSANGNYVFKVLDNAGNEISQTVSVTKIDKIAPTVNITGNPTSWTKNNVTLTITGADSQSGIKQIEKPDGQVVTGSSTTYKVSANGNYTFKVTDNAGNTTTQTVSVTKIDKTAPTVNITGNPTSWTKNNVTLTITGADSQSGVKQIEKPDGTVVTGSSTTYTVSANGTYTFKITDNVGNVLTQTVSVTKIDKTNPTINITGNPTAWTNKNVTLTITASDTGGGVKQITLPNGQVVTGSSTTYTVTANGNYVFKVLDNAGNEISQTVSVTKIDKTNPTISVTGVPEGWVNHDVELTVTVKDALSGVKEVILPDGNIVEVGGKNTYTFTYTTTTGGRQHITIKDNAGNVFDTGFSNIIVSIDKMSPTLWVDANTTKWTNQNVTLSISGRENPIGSSSGIKEITLPDGSIVSGSTATYEVTKNGNYTVKMTDNAGNTATVIKTISNIDKVKPTIEVTGNPTSWTNKDVTLTIKGSDSASGIKQITKPDGTVVTGSSTTYTVSANGNYVFKVTDNAGNEITQTVSVTKIDKTNPTATVTGNPTDWTNKDVTLTIKGADTQSGVKSITKPDGTVATGTSTTYKVSENGTYTFKITDNAGNVLTQTVNVTKIDKAGPVISYALTPNTWTNGDVTINLTVNDVGAGLKEIHMPNGTVVSTLTASYTVSKNGAYYFKAVDNLGNETILPILVTNIDVKAPSLNINNKQNWTNQDVQINITGTD